jgi:hypothetical protein
MFPWGHTARCPGLGPDCAKGIGYYGWDRCLWGEGRAPQTAYSNSRVYSLHCLLPCHVPAARIKRPCGLNFGSSCGTLFVTSMDGFVHRFAGPQHQHAGTHLSVIQLTPGPSITLDLPGPSGSVTTALPQHGAEGVLAGGVADHSLALSTTVLQPWQNTGGQGPELPPNVLPWDVLAVKGNTLIISMHKNRWGSCCFQQPVRLLCCAHDAASLPEWLARVLSACA